MSRAAVLFLFFLRLMGIDAFTQRLPAGVWLRRTVYEASASSTWEEWLSDEERACLEEFGAAVRQQEFVAGRAVARDLLADVLDTTPEAVPLRQADDGGVNIHGSDWNVSISHSAEHAVAVCARHPIGVDLEEIQPRDEGIARFLLHPESRSEGLLDRLPYAEDEALILCWTLKEAVLKARRSGFRRSPKALRLEVNPNRRQATVDVEDGATWAARYERLDDFILSVAYPEGRSAEE